MEIGIIGLGKMGLNIALNLLGKKHKVIGFDLDPSSRKHFSNCGGHSVDSIPLLPDHLNQRRIIWLMVPAGEAVDQVIDQLIPDLEKGDIIIDGGNSFYKDSIKRFNKLAEHGIDFMDCGTSGGLEGALNGACLTIGGNPEVFQTCESLFKDIAIQNGYMYTGGPGSGHFVKMVHNGIEYGMMQAIGEGYEIMENSGFDLDLKDVSSVWSHGSVIRSWLVELCEDIFIKNSKLDGIPGVIASSGEGKWCVETADELNIETPAMKAALDMRERSKIKPSFSSKLLASLRNQFGGHEINPNAK